MERAIRAAVSSRRRVSGFTSRLINAYGGISEDQIVNGAGSLCRHGDRQRRHLGDADGCLPRQPAKFVIASCAYRYFAHIGHDERRNLGDDHRNELRVRCNRDFWRNGGGQRRAWSAVPTITATTPAHAAGAVNVVVTNSNGQSGTLTNGYTYTSSGTIMFVQVASGPPTIQASNTSVAVAYVNTQTAGNLNIVVAGWGDTTSSISSVTDSKGNTYTRAVGPDHRYRIARVHLLRQEHRRRHQHSDGQVQPGSGLSRCPHSGVQRA